MTDTLNITTVDDPIAGFFRVMLEKLLRRRLLLLQGRRGRTFHQEASQEADREASPQN